MAVGSSSSAVEPNGWVWWIWAWCRAISNKAPAAYLGVGDKIDGDIVIRKNHLQPYIYTYTNTVIRWLKEWILLI
ncbi:hypothetical protein Vadar_002507 [Vaccinium darrowii]|uniref:Uncharacterized protein n=1 Tax=Vaccinium darrowii TaxID=229202 RepID=A0ACB7Z179_9ERIC|nr:hypothetical protein Vadar_002507 [Vaccinium darrowii]